MESIIEALKAVALGAIPLIGGILFLCFRLAKARLENKIKAEERKASIENDAALRTTLSDSAQFAVKSVSQALTAHQRDPEGRLPPKVAITAKETARAEALRVLGPKQVELLTAKYGTGEALDAAIDIMLEAALHDVKATVVTTSTKTSDAAVLPSGSVITTEKTKTTSATEPQTGGL